MQNSSQPPIIALANNTPNTVTPQQDSNIVAQVQPNNLNKRWLDQYVNFSGIKIYRITNKDLDLYKNKEIWIASFLYCLMMDRIYLKKYLIVNSKSLRFGCTLMNIMIPYLALFHGKLIYKNYVSHKI